MTPHTVIIIGAGCDHSAEPECAACKVPQYTIHYTVCSIVHTAVHAVMCSIGHTAGHSAAFIAVYTAEPLQYTLHCTLQYTL